MGSAITPLVILPYFPPVIHPYTYPTPGGMQPYPTPGGMQPYPTPGRGHTLNYQAYLNSTEAQRHSAAYEAHLARASLEQLQQPQLPIFPIPTQYHDSDYHPYLADTSLLDQTANQQEFISDFQEII